MESCASVLVAIRELVTDAARVFAVRDELARWARLIGKRMQSWRGKLVCSTSRGLWR